MKWTIDKSRLPDFVRVETSGPPDLDDLMTMWDEIVESDFWQPGFTVLLDNRKLKEAKDPSRYVSAAIEYFAENKDRLGTACIAALGVKSVSFQHARRFQYGIRLKGSDVVLQMFDSESQALAWIDHFCKLRGDKGETPASVNS
jgi:hypothetical protein